MEMGTRVSVKIRVIDIVGVSVIVKMKLNLLSLCESECENECVRE